MSGRCRVCDKGNDSRILALVAPASSSAGSLIPGRMDRWMVCDTGETSSPLWVKLGVASGLPMAKEGLASTATCRVSEFSGVEGSGVPRIGAGAPPRCCLSATEFPGSTPDPK